MASKNTKFAHLLLTKGVSSKELCDLTGIGKTHLSLIKNGAQNLTIDTLKKLCVALKCSPNDLLEWESWE